MAFRLSKQEMKQRDEHIEILRKAKLDVETAVEKYIEAMEEPRDTLRKAIEDYNEAIVAAKGFAEDIASQADSDISDKSDKWQEGERGQAASDWKGEWENIDLDEITFEYPEEIEPPDMDHAESLENLPEAAEF